MIDDKFPCIDRKPMFMEPKDKELWVILLEKGWAKLCGSYENTFFSSVGEILEHFTGFPIVVFENDVNLTIFV
jgi:hypothetical protein